MAQRHKEWLLRRECARMPDVLFHLWAKSDPFHPLPCHLIDVGQTALALLETLTFEPLLTRWMKATGMTEEESRPWVAYLVALHDIGKAADPFQSSVEELVAPLRTLGFPPTPQENGFRHEALSAAWLQYWLRVQGWGRKPALTVAAAIRLHHSRFGTPPVPVLKEGPFAPWESARIRLAGLISGIFRPPAVSPVFRDHSTAGVILSGLVVLADWIASNPDLFEMTWALEPIEEYAAKSRNRAVRAIEALGFHQPLPWHPDQRFRELWPSLKNPRPIQEACEALCLSGAEPGLLTIEAPMGEGKTEAALYVASQWGKGGLYFALPTAATSNQMHGRVSDLAQLHGGTLGEQVQLVHGQAWLVDKHTPEQEPNLADENEGEALAALDWFKPKKRALLALLGVGTVDQAMMAAMHVRHGFLRLLGLAGKALVIDECHAYDTYMGTILDQLLRWCGHLGVPVVLLSATLPGKRRAELVKAYCSHVADADVEGRDSYPLLTYVSPSGQVSYPTVAGSGTHSSIHLERHWGLLGDAEAIAQLAWSKVQNGGCLAVIMNTVDEAQAVYQILEPLVTKGPPCELLLFHGRFRYEVRQEIERRVLSYFGKDTSHRPTRGICVATQVIEQSLDIDFDEMISAIAPVDLTLQRMGRLHRHKRDDIRPTGNTPYFHLLLPADGVAHFGPAENHVYSRYYLMRTAALLRDKTEVNLPDDIRTLVEEVYDPKAASGLDDYWPAAEVEAARKKLDQDLAREAAEAKKYLLPAPSADSFEVGKLGTSWNEAEEGAISYMAARTRQGDESLTVLLLEGEKWRDELARKHPPGRDVLADIWAQMVKIPRRWLKDVTAAEGFHPPEEPGPRWLPGVTVLRLHQGYWRGQGAKGKVRVIHDHPTLGVRSSIWKGGG